MNATSDDTGTNDRQARGRRLRKRLKIAALAAGILVAIALSAKYLLLPGAVRAAAEDQLSRRWRGGVSIDDVDFRYFGPLEVSGVRVRDEKHRTWFTLDRASVRWSAWPNIVPAVTEVHLVGPHVTLQVRQGKLSIPLREVPEEPGKPEGDFWPASLRRLRVEDMRTRVIDETGTVGGFGPFLLRIAREERGDTMRLDLHDTAAKGDEQAALQGAFSRATGEADLELTLSRGITLDLSRPVLTVLGADWLRGVTGQVTTRSEESEHIAITGSLRDAAGLNLSGRIAFEDCSVLASHGMPVHAMGWTVDFGEGDDGGRRVELSDFRAGATRGRITGSADALLGRDWSLKRVTGKFEGRKLSLKDLQRTFGLKPRNPDIRDAMEFIATLNSDGEGFDGVRIDVALKMDNANLWHFPVFGAIFSHLDMKAHDPTSLSDLAGDFHIKAGSLTAGRIRLSSRLYAIEIQPGGVLDLSSGRLKDLQVVAIPLGKVETLLGRIPVIREIMSVPEAITKDLVALRVSGNVYRDEVRVVPATVSNLRRETVEFFRTVGEAGGDLLQLVPST